jgi:hypothetical protein
MSSSKRCEKLGAVHLQCVTLTERRDGKEALSESFGKEASEKRLYASSQLKKEHGRDVV